MVNRATARLVGRNSLLYNMTYPDDARILRQRVIHAVRKVTVDLDCPEWAFYYWNSDTDLLWIRCHSLLLVTSRLDKLHIDRAIIKALNDFRELQPLGARNVLRLCSKASSNRLSCHQANDRLGS